MKLAWGLICGLLLALQLSSARASDASLEASARDFVQQFYDSYVPKAAAEKRGPAWRFAIDDMSARFDGELLEALKDDAAAEAQSGDESDGLDFDPFMNSQDPAERYEVGSVSQDGPTFLANVYAVASGKRSAEPSVIAALAHKDGHWLFVNFRYPGNDDLLTILRVLKEGRKGQQD
jgi:hypothetical protein